VRNLVVILFAASLVTVPAFLFWFFIQLIAHAEYYFIAYASMALVYLAGSFLSAITIVYRISHEESPKNITGNLFKASTTAWLVSLLTLTILNLTPLCVGQDNGDGSNDVKLCVIYTWLVALSCSSLVVPISWIACLLANRLIHSIGSK
jgi:hypothetical protein